LEVGQQRCRAAEATGPVLLMHGSVDPMPVSQSTDVADSLRAAGNDIDLAVVDGANHGFDIKGGQLTSEGELAAARVLGWLERHFS
jgi:dipeptidyl aminopeptidase/acylaminoacyl peptidase